MLFYTHWNGWTKKFWQVCGVSATLIFPGMNIKPLLNNVWQFLEKLNIHWRCDPAIPLLGISPREMKAYVHARVCTCVFIATLFIIVTKKWKQPEGLTIGELISNLTFTIWNTTDKIKKQQLNMQQHVFI